MMGSHRTVLLWEDDLDHVFIIRYILEGEGFTVVHGDPQRYSGDIERYRPGVILLDQWLKGTLGSTICKKLKADPCTSQIPVILTSASNKIEEIADECQPDDILPKPFDTDVLVRKVSRWFKNDSAKSGGSNPGRSL